MEKLKLNSINKKQNELEQSKTEITIIICDYPIH